MNCLTIKLTLVCSCFILIVLARSSFCGCDMLRNNNVVISFKNCRSHRPCKLKFCHCSIWLFIHKFPPLCDSTLNSSFARHQISACVLALLLVSHWNLPCYSSFFVLCVGRDSSVGTATRYGLDGTGIEYRWGRGFPHRPDRPWVPSSLLYNGYRIFPGG